VCALCSQSTPWNQANGTARGLVCTRCTPEVIIERQQKAGPFELIDSVLAFIDDV
jgi:hypothetical protein